MQLPSPDHKETRRLFAALAIASGRPEDRFAPDWRMPYVLDTLGMLLGQREPEDARERRALKFFRQPDPAPTAQRRPRAGELITL
jgi:hypothetical protein